jgi:hypothetical protein
MESQMALYKKNYIHKNPMVFFPTKIARLSIPKPDSFALENLPGCGAGSGLGSETTEEGEAAGSRTTLASIS